MVYMDQQEVTDTVARLNARIGGLRKNIKAKKNAIADRCVEKYRTAMPFGGAIQDGDISRWCREIIEQEEQIRSLLAEIQEYKYLQPDPLEQYFQPEPPAPQIAVAPTVHAPVFSKPAFSGAVFSESVSPEPVFAKPEREIAAPPPPQAQHHAAPFISAPEPVVAAPVLPTYVPVTPPPEPVAALIICSVCGVKNPSGTRFCQECGEKLEAVSAPVVPVAPVAPTAPVAQQSALPLFCPTCGEPAIPGDRFCGGCGERFA